MKPLVECVVVDGVEDIAFAGESENGMIADGLPFELDVTSGVGSVGEFALDVCDEDGSA